MWLLLKGESCVIYHFSKQQTICRINFFRHPRFVPEFHGELASVIYIFGLFSEYLENADGGFLKDFEPHLLGRTRFAGSIDGRDAENIAACGETLE